MSSAKSDGSEVTTRTPPGQKKTLFKGPAPKAEAENTASDFGGIVEDGMPLSPHNADATVQFLPEGNGDAKVEIGNSIAAPNFVGLGKEELMKYANDPFWVRLRWMLFLLFWLLWASMLAGAIVIIILAPKCADKSKVDIQEPVYQIFLKSFANNGKLEDLQKHTDYLKELGIKTVIISQVTKGSPTRNVVHFEKVDEEFGTFEDFKQVVKHLKAENFNVLLQLVPNHAGKNHSWFIDRPDFFVAKLTSEVKDSSWRTVDGRNAWASNDSSSSYLHQFSQSEADFDYRNEGMITEMNKVLEFWMTTTEIDGFLLSDVSYLVEDLSSLNDVKATKNQKENIDVLNKILRCSEWTRTPAALLDIDISSVKDIEGYSSNETSKDTHVVVDLLSEIKSTSSASDVEQVVKFLQDKDNLFIRVSGPRIGRSSNRLGSQSKANLLSMIAFAMKGKVLLYYGDEVGETNLQVTPSTDPFDKSVEKMSWTDNKPKSDPLLQKFYQDLIKTFTTTESNITNYHSDGSVFTFMRSDKYAIAVNFGKAARAVDFHKAFDYHKSAAVKVVTPGFATDEKDSTLTLAGESGVVLFLDE